MAWVRATDRRLSFPGRGVRADVRQVPIQSSFVDKKLLTKVERRWLQEHNCECLHKLRPLLAHDPRAIKWLKRQC